MSVIKIETHPIYHKKNGKKLSVYIYGLNRSKGGGCYTEFLFERGADGKYVKCKDEKQEKELLFGLEFFAFIFGIFCIFLLVTKNADLLGILFMLLLFAVCVGFGYIMYKRDIKKAEKYIKEQGLD